MDDPFPKAQDRFDIIAAAYKLLACTDATPSHAYVVFANGTIVGVDRETVKQYHESTSLLTPEHLQLYYFYEQEPPDGIIDIINKDMDRCEPFVPLAWAATIALLADPYIDPSTPYVVTADEDVYVARFNTHINLALTFYEIAQNNTEDTPDDTNTANTTIENRILDILEPIVVAVIIGVDLFMIE
jgi:hypothetical protein